MFVLVFGMACYSIIINNKPCLSLTLIVKIIMFAAPLRDVA